MSRQVNEELTLDDLETVETKPKDLIIVEQLPIIRQTLEVMSAEIDRKTAAALVMICTEETVKEVKSIRAELTKDFTDLEDRRKTVKKAVLSPYDEFEKIYKELISDKFNSAIGQLKTKIDTVESELKSRKEQDVMRYFAELCAANSIDFVAFEQMGLNVTLTVTLPALKKQIATFIEHVVSDVALIETQGEHKNEIMVEYKKHLFASKAITDVVGRHKALEEEKIRQAEREAARSVQNERVAQVNTFLPPPTQTPVSSPQRVVEASGAGTKEYNVMFKVYGTIEQLKAMKAYLVANNLRYENLPAPVAPRTITVEHREGPAPEEKTIVSITGAGGGGDRKPEPNKDTLPIAYVVFQNKEGEFGGREYSYVIPDRLIAEVAGNCNCLVDVATKHGIVSGLVTRLGTTADVAADIIPKLMKLEGITKEEEVEK